MAHKIIGTAGHIDHGKSSLVRALTGTDPDRLAEEQQRGMTIDLGFAFLNENIAFIDVPGHEKFIKNMVAGVSTIDLALLIIAADDGVMPQTREHLDILKLLRLEYGAIALTKIDMVEEEWLQVVEEDVRQWVRGSFLEKAPILRVSSTTGEGVEPLRQTLIALAERTPSRQERGLFWMPVDRSFTIKGYGTVATGSVLSGKVSVGDTLELLPQKRPVRVRGIQTHGFSSSSTGIGERAALNLMNISKEEIQRGDILSSPGQAEPATRFDVRLSLLPTAPQPLTSRMRIRLHIGTREIMARIKLLDREKLNPGASGLAQLHLEEAAAALKRDPFIIRFYSPQFTIGGGIVLDANARPHRRSDRRVIERLKGLEEYDPQEMVVAALAQPDKAPIKITDLSRETGIAADELRVILDMLISRQIVLEFDRQFFIHGQNFDRLKDKIQSLLAAFHQKEPLRPGLKKAYLSAQIKSAPPVFEAALHDLAAEGIIRQAGDQVSMADFHIFLTPRDQQLGDEILKIFSQAPFATPPTKILAQMTSRSTDDVQRVLNALQGMGQLVRLDEEIFLTTDAVKAAQGKLAEFAKSKKEIAVSEFRELLETSRKFALPLLNYFDENGVTERIGEIRQILQKKNRS